MTKRAAKYRRISRDREGRELGVERQDEDLDALAARRGLTVVADYCDNDLGASTRSRKTRPEYQRMLADARAGRFDVVLAYTSGRITRRPRENEDLIELSEQHGIRFEYVRSPSFDLNTSAGRRVARILAANDAGEAEDIAERVSRAKDQAAGRGQWLGGRRPYGFEDDGTTVREAEAEVIREGVNAIIAGASLRGLAAAWNARGLVTSTGKLWRQDTVGRMLTRARNAGLLVHRGKVVGPAAWPAIVPEDRWRAVCGVLADPARRTQWTSTRRWLLSGLALCGVCGGPVVCTMMSTAPRGVPSYTCRASRGHVVRNAAELEAFVTVVVVERLSRPDARDLLSRQAPERTAEQNAELLSLRTRRKSLARLLADDVLTEAEVRTEAPALDAQIAELEAALDGPKRDDVLAAVVLSDDPPAAWEVLELDRKRAVIDTLMTVRIERTRKGRPAGWKRGDSYFNPEAITIEWKGAS